MVSSNQILAYVRVVDAVSVPKLQFGRALKHAAGELRVVDAGQFHQNELSGLVKADVGLNHAELVDPLLEALIGFAHYLIRFFLAALGMECTNPLSIRYVRGVFFPGMPLPDDLARGASEDWTFPNIPQLAAAE